MDSTLRVRGLREFQRAVSKADANTRKTVREGLKKAGEPVRSEWQRTLSRYDERSASKLRVRARQSGVLVEQSLRKTTALRPDWGRLQQVLGEQAAADKENEVERELEQAIDGLADELEGRGFLA